MQQNNILEIFKNMNIKCSGNLNIRLRRHHKSNKQKYHPLISFPGDAKVTRASSTLPNAFCDSTKNLAIKSQFSASTHIYTCYITVAQEYPHMP